MGHYCSLCGCSKPNEQFSGKGHRTHVCKSCRKMPKARRQEIRDQNFVWLVMDQKNISKGNIQTLEQIRAIYAGRLGEQAAAVVEMAKVKPHRKKRFKWLHDHRHPLFLELVRLDLLECWNEEEYEMLLDARIAMELRCLEIDTELRFHAELLEAYEADVMGGVS